MVPLYLQRLDDAMSPDLAGLSRTNAQTYTSQAYVTPSGMLNLPHFEFVHKIMGTDRIIYAVDDPYLSNTGACDFLERLHIS